MRRGSQIRCPIRLSQLLEASRGSKCGSKRFAAFSAAVLRYREGPRGFWRDKKKARKEGGKVKSYKELSTNAPEVKTKGGKRCRSGKAKRDLCNGVGRGEILWHNDGISRQRNRVGSGRTKKKGKQGMETGVGGAWPSYVGLEEVWGRGTRGPRPRRGNAPRTTEGRGSACAGRGWAVMSPGQYGKGFHWGRRAGPEVRSFSLLCSWCCGFITSVASKDGI